METLPSDESLAFSAENRAFRESTLILSNGHGQWGYHISDAKYAYLYHKLIYDQNGNSFGVAHTAATVTLSPDGQHFEATLSIQFTDNQGKVVLSATGTATGTSITLAEAFSQ
jgi:hypothetical protein